MFEFRIDRSKTDELMSICVNLLKSLKQNARFQGQYSHNINLIAIFHRKLKILFYFFLIFVSQIQIIQFLREKIALKLLTIPKN